MRVLNKAKKSLGQNFLIDKNIIKKIIEIGNIDKKKNNYRNWSWLWKFNKRIGFL